jgi:hypothetical protein
LFVKKFRDRDRFPQKMTGESEAVDVEMVTDEPKDVVSDVPAASVSDVPTEAIADADAPPAEPKMVLSSSATVNLHGNVCSVTPLTMLSAGCAVPPGAPGG